MMGKVIISSSHFLSVLLRVNDKVEEIINVIGSGDCLIFKNIGIKAECLSDVFQIPLYKSTIRKLLKILMLLEDQPITLKFEDSEIFNVTILSAIV